MLGVFPSETCRIVRPTDALVSTYEVTTGIAYPPPPPTYFPPIRRSRDITSEPLPAVAPRSPTSMHSISISRSNTEGGISSAGPGDPPSHGVQRESSVVEIGPDGETREWRVGAVEMGPTGEMEREWGMGRV